MGKIYFFLTHKERLSRICYRALLECCQTLGQSENLPVAWSIKQVWVYCLLNYLIHVNGPNDFHIITVTDPPTYFRSLQQSLWVEDVLRIPPNVNPSRYRKYGKHCLSRLCNAFLFAQGSRLCSPLYLCILMSYTKASSISWCTSLRWDQVTEVLMHSILGLVVILANIL